MKPTHSYRFTLTLEGYHTPTEKLENALFEAGCDDALLYFREQIGYLEFERSSESLEQAILSAIRDVESSEAVVKVARVEPSDLVTSAEISRRLKRSRESVRLLINGQRGVGGFPHPVAGVTTKTLIWSWSAVTEWLFNNNKIDDPEVVRQALLIRQINEALDMRNTTNGAKKVHDLLQKLPRIPVPV